MSTLPYAGFKPHREGRIHILCPRCGRKFSNLPRDEWDPPTAVLAHLVCEDCGQGGFVEGPDRYLDAHGKDCGWVVCPECGTGCPYYEWKQDGGFSCCEDVGGLDA